MRAVVIPFGEPGRAEKQRALRDALSARPGPPFLYNDILLIVPSARLRRTYGRTALEMAARTGGTAAISPPEVLTLHQFFQRLGARHVPRRLIDETSRLVLLEGIVKERLAEASSFAGPPDILAPSLSSAVADMIEELSSAGITPERLSAVLAESGISDKFQVRLLDEAYARYAGVLAENGLVDPAGMLASLADRFDPSWLGGYGTIIIDGLHDATELQIRVLRKFAAAGNVIFQVDAPSPEVLRRSGDLHPLRLTREFLARLGLMTGEASLAEDRDASFLADALFSARTFAEAARNAPAGFSREIRLDSAVNAREEITHIAGMVKRSLRSGTVLDSIVVAFPSLDEYAPLVEEIFTDYGIPYNRALGRQLSTSSVTTSLLSLLQAVLDDFSAPSLLRVFSSPFLSFSDNPSIGPALDRLMRDHRIAGGKTRLLSAIARRDPAEDGRDVLSGPLNSLFPALEPFSARESAPLSLWMDRLVDLLTWSGIRERVELIKGPLNINLQALRKLNDTIGSLRQAGRLFPSFRYSFSEWLFLLRKTFMHARFQVPPDDEGGVQVLGLEETIGRAWSEVYLGGLVDGSFPQRLPQNIFLPEATLEALGVRTLENARMAAAYHFYRVLLSAPKVVLTRPENVGDKPVVPSPFLAELEPLRLAGLLRESSGIQFSLAIEDSLSVPELAKSVGAAGNVEGLEPLLAIDAEGMPAIGAALAERRTVPARPVIAPRRREFRVTELEEYLRCPYDYYVMNVLGIEPLAEVTEDLSPLDRGTRVHGILRDFYRAWTGPVTRERRKDAAALLASIAGRSFGYDADTFRNRREKELFLTIMAERFLDAEEGFWKQGMRPAYLEQKIEFFTLTLSDGETAEIHAKIDRIDVDEHGNFIIVDYKTGKYPQPTMTVDQEIFQLPLYAVMAKEALGGKDPTIRKPIGLAYYDLSGRVGPGARDVVLFDREARDDHPSIKPQASRKSPAEFGQILNMSVDKAKKAIEGILRGEFPATPLDENRCRYCQNEMLCERKEP